MHASKSHSRASQKSSTHAHHAEHSTQEEMEAQMHHASQTISSEAHKHPTVTVVGISALGLIAASIIGVGEVAIAGAAGYLAYRWLMHSRKTKEHGQHSQQM
jgi:hypothetical protein